MVGQCNFRVPDNMDGDNRITLSPSILLERTHARVEFIFTTVDDGGNYLSPLLPLSKVTKLSLNNEVSGYSVLPSAGEYTATGGGNPDIRALEPTYSRNIIKLQIINNQALFGVHSKSKSF